MVMRMAQYFIREIQIVVDLVHLNVVNVEYCFNFVIHMKQKVKCGGIFFTAMQCL